MAGLAEPERQRPLGRQARKKLQTRLGIVDAARRLFLTRGYEQSTVEEISEAADVSRATFFNHFPTKQALLLELASEMDSRLERMLDRQCEREASTEERLTGLFADTLGMIAKTEELSRRLILDASMGGISSRDYGERREILLRAFVRLLEIGREQGDVCARRDLRVLAEVVGGAYSYCVLTYAAGARLPLEQRPAELAQVLAQAVAPCPDDHA